MDWYCSAFCIVVDFLDKLKALNEGHDNTTLQHYKQRQ